MKKRIVALVATAFCMTSVFSFSSCLDLGDFGSADYEKWSENILTTTLRANVTVKKNKTVFQGSATLSQGSGMIFYQDANSYYALTNYHVAYRDSVTSGVISVKYSVTDCFGNTDYSAVNMLYGDADYDLAVIRFDKKYDVTLSVTPLATTNPKSFEPVATIGQSEGVHNGVTFGKTIGYERVQITGEDVQYSNVQFPALVHNCYTLGGSSGGGVINENLQLVGIHYACGFDEEGDFVEGYAVPVEKIRDFLADAETQTDVELGV